MLQTSQTLATTHQKNDAMSSVFKRSKNTHDILDKVDTWQRDTWCTLKSHTRSRVPTRLYGPKSSFSFLHRLIRAKNEDEFGWVKMKNGRFYNIHTKKSLNKHPFHAQEEGSKASAITLPPIHTLSSLHML